jgi:D-lyxose ketol-isomerase
VKRSEINALLREASSCFSRNGWHLPPEPRWDVTDFGLGDWHQRGLVLVNLTAQPEYCEKLMYARAGMTTPCHCHHRKKEDIICRCGELLVHAWPGRPVETSGRTFAVEIDGRTRTIKAGEDLVLRAGQRITVPPRVYHEFVPTRADTIIGEVSTANDDVNDNFFDDPNVGRFPQVDEDEPPLARLVSDR